MSKTSKSISLSVPIVRGDKKITEITLHKPNVGVMRGISMSAVLNMNVDAIADVLPRISDPKMTEAEISAMDLPDLLMVGVAVASFFIPTMDTELPA